VAYGKTQVYEATNTYGANSNIGGSWNFGFMTLSGFYQQIKVDADKQNNWYLGALAPIGDWQLRASCGHVDRSGMNPANIEGQKAWQFAAGAV